MTAPQRATVWISLVGVLAATVYAVWAAVCILALNPLAAVPGTGLGEIYEAMSDADERFSTGWVLGFLAIGPVLTVVSTWVCIVNRVPPIGGQIPIRARGCRLRARVNPCPPASR